MKKLATLSFVLVLLCAQIFGALCFYQNGRIEAQQRALQVSETYMVTTLNQVTSLVTRLEKVESDNARYRETFVSAGVDPDLVLTHKFIPPSESQPDTSEQPKEQDSTEPHKQQYSKNGPWQMSLGKNL